MAGRPARYSKALIWIHWISALLIFALFAVGLYMTNVDPKSPLKTTLFQMHALVGYLVGLLTMVRLVLLFKHGKPAPPPGLAGPRLLAFHAVHWLIYLGIFLMVISGAQIFLQSGMSPLPWAIRFEDIDFNVPAVGRHLTLKFFLAGLILAHIAGVLSYQVTKGDVLSRMGLGRGG